MREQDWAVPGGRTAAEPAAAGPATGAPATGAPASGAPATSRGRTIAATVLGVLAVVTLTLTVVAVWAKATVLRSERVAELVADALAEPEVQGALAAHIADQVATAVDLEAVLTGLLPDALDRFAPTIASGARSAVERRLTTILASSDVQQVLRTVVERAHARAIDLLEGDGLVEGVSVEDGEVTLNLLPLVGRGLTALQSVGLLQDVDVPELAASGDPAEQVAELSTSLGRDLSDDFGQVVVYRSDALADAQESVQNAQRLLVLAQRAVWLLAVATVVLIAATIVVAARRWRAALVLGIGTAATMVVLRTAIRQVVDDAPALVDRPGARAALDTVLRDAGASLLRVAGVVLLVALALALIALLQSHWSPQDLVLVAAVAVGAGAVAALGVSLVAVVMGIVLAVALPFVVRWLAPPAPAQPA